MVAIAADLEPQAENGWDIHSDIHPAARHDVTAASLLQVLVVPSSGVWHARLGELIDTSIESELELQGAPPRAPAPNPEQQLSDQLYRSRLLGHCGISVHLGDLSALTDNGVLSPLDSETLRWWLRATAGQGVHVALSEALLELKAYASPVTVSELQQLLCGELGAPELSATTPSTLEFETPIVVGEPSSPELSLSSFAPDVPSHEPRESEFATPYPTLGIEPSLDATESLATTAEQSEEPACCELAEAEEPTHVRAWCESLDEATGAQSWETLERLFLSSYLPLMHWLETGNATPSAIRSAEVWAQNFQGCYQTAFTRLRAGAARPTMVLDVPQLAFQAARESGVTQVKLVLVDGMRFDLGQRVHDRLRLQLTGLAQCVQRRVLWSALPATTSTQLELLARGAVALGRTTGGVDERTWSGKGSEARKTRALRVGPHHLRKLDILEAEFAHASWTASDLERAAAEVAVSVGRFIKQQAGNTLVAVFGDHGLPSAARPREATPEEVLVPFHAWLVHDTSDFGHGSN